MRHIQPILSNTLVFLKKKWSFVLALILLFFVSGMGINLPLVAVSLYLAYKLCLILITPRIANSRLFVTFIAFFFYVLILQSISLVTWLVLRDFPLSLNIPIAFAVIVATYFPIRRIHKPAERRMATIGDVASGIVVLVTFAIFVLFPVYNTQSHSEASLLNLANYNVDDGSHLGMLNARLHYNVATTSGNDADISSQVPGGISYPSGWPAANAALIQALSPSIEVGGSTLVAYILTKIFWLLFLVFVFTRTIFALYTTFSPNSPQTPAIVWIILGSLIFTAWFVVDPFFYGFFSFLPQLITVLLFILVTIQLADLNKKTDKLLLYLVLPITLSVGAALSWFLLFPVFIAALFLTFLRRVSRLNIKTVLKELTVNISRFALLYVVIVLSLVAQLYMTLSSSSTGVSSSFLHSLLLNGGITTYPISFYAVILLGCVAFFFFTAKKELNEKLSAILSYLVVMLAFASFIYFIQLYKIHENLYYYFKVLNTVTIVAIPLAILGIAFLATVLQDKTSKYVAAMCSIIIGFAIVQFAYPGAPFIGYASGSRAVSESVNQQIYSTLKAHEQTASYDDGVVTIFYPSKNPILNEVASTLVQSSKPYTKCYAALKGASFSTPARDFSVSPIRESCSERNHIVYYVDPDMVESVKQTVDMNDLSSRVTVKSITY